jgi:RimJ/RimL family protein N-acetyltransferase
MEQINFFRVLENERVLLRPLHAEDTTALAAIALREPELWQHTATVIRTEEDMVQYIGTALQERDRKESVPFVIMDKKTGQVAGCTRYMNPDSRHKCIEIGWTWIGKASQGTGLNKAMKYLLLQYAFEALEMNRVELKTSEHNALSQNALASIGAREEGTLRRHMINDDGTVRDTVYFSILREEWPRIRETVFSGMK